MNCNGVSLFRCRGCRGSLPPGSFPNHTGLVDLRFRYSCSRIPGMSRHGFKPGIPSHGHKPRRTVDQTNACFRTSRVSLNVSERFLYKCEKRSTPSLLAGAPCQAIVSSRTSILLRSANASIYQRTAESNPLPPAATGRALKKRCPINSIAARRVRGSPKCAQRIESSASEFLPPRGVRFDCKATRI
jgi:hypothetical protein